MKTKMSILILLFVTIAGVARAAPSAVTIDQWVIGAGGSQVSSGVYELQYTLGQPVATEVETGSHHLCAGYWCDPVFRIYLPMVVRLP